MTVRNKVQLITYPDSLGGNLTLLGHVLDRYFPDLFEGGIHILPPYPSSGDRGFAPINQMEIDPRFGTWEDIRRLGTRYPILLDLIVNHISARSPQFRDFLQNGANSPYADMFLPIEKFWPDKNPPREDIEKIFLRRPTPFSDYVIEGTQEVRTLWTTFGKTTPSEQVDLDIYSPAARNYLKECFVNFSRNNVKIVRLDAIGYVVKKIGTSCFFVEPDIYEFLEWLKSIAEPLDIDLLPELHADFSTQLKLSQRGYWIYDFILPYMILEALLFKNTQWLKAYLAVRPPRQFTMLDCHDGIPVKPDLDGLLDVERAQRVVQTCLERGANLSRIFSPKYKDQGGFDVHQIRGTYYSMLGCDDQAYLIARAIQLFVPGIPQVYYVGLLAGENDRLEGDHVDGREINRHNYSIPEIEQALERPVVKNLVTLIRFRNSYPAFEGSFTLNACSDHEVALRWDKQEAYASLHADLQANTLEIRYYDPVSKTEKRLALA